MCRAELFPAGRGGARMKIRKAGRGKDENPRVSLGRGGAKKHVNQLIQNFDKSALIVTGGLYYSMVLSPAGFVNFCGRGKACFLRGGASIPGVWAVMPFD